MSGYGRPRHRRRGHGPDCPGARHHGRVDVLVGNDERPGCRSGARFAGVVRLDRHLVPRGGRTRVQRDRCRGRVSSPARRRKPCSTRTVAPWRPNSVQAVRGGERAARLIPTLTAITRHRVTEPCRLPRRRGGAAEVRRDDCRRDRGRPGDVVRLGTTLSDLWTWSAGWVVSRVWVWRSCLLARRSCRPMRGGGRLDDHGVFGGALVVSGRSGPQVVPRGRQQLITGRGRPDGRKPR